MKNTVKKIFSIVLCCVLVLGMLTGCGGGTDSKKETKAKKETEKKVENPLEGTVWNYEEMEVRFKKDMTVEVVDVSYNDFEQYKYTWDSKNEKGEIKDDDYVIYVTIEDDRLRLEADGEGMYMNKGPADVEAYTQTEEETEDDDIEDITYEDLSGMWFNEDLNTYLEFVDEEEVTYEDDEVFSTGTYYIDGEDVYMEFEYIPLSLSGFIDSEGDLLVNELDGWFVYQ